MPVQLTDGDWNILRQYLDWLLQDADGQIDLPLGSRTPSTTDEMYFLMQGWSFDCHLADTLRFTSEALQNAATQFKAAQRLAEAIQVNAPDDDLLANISKDLRLLGKWVKNDQRSQALSDFFGAAADVVKDLRKKDSAAGNG